MVRITEVSTVEEPGAGKLHTGTCAGVPGNRYLTATVYKEKID